PLEGTSNRQREMDLGFDWKSNGSDLEFGGIPVPGGAPPAEIFQFSLGYKETIQHKRGVTQFDIRGVWSPGDFNGHNSDFVFNANRLGLTSDYFYATASVEHQRRLRDD